MTISLKGMTWDHPRGYACLDACSEHYAQQTGVNISWDRRSLQAFADAAIDDLSQTYDFIVLDHPHVGQISATGCLLPLPPLRDAATASMGGSVESYFWNDTLWAYPVDAACQMAVRRPDIDHPIPRTWQDIVVHPDLYPKTITPLLPVDAVDMMMTLVAGRKEENLPYSDSRFTSEENGLVALKVLKALFKLGPSEAVSWNPIKVLEALSTTDEFAYSPCLFGYINYARPGFRSHQLIYDDLPLFEDFSARRGILGGAGIGVSSNSRFPDEAVAFAQWVCSEPVQSGVYLENEGQPAHRQTWQKKADDPDYSGFFSGAFKTMSEAWTRPRDDWFLRFIDDVCEIFPDFFLKDQSEEAFLSDINSLYRSHKAQKAVA